jgi:hypothetical protein
LRGFFSAPLSTYAKLILWPSRELALDANAAAMPTAQPRRIIGIGTQLMIVDN